MLLDTTDKVQLITSSAANIDWATEWMVVNAGAVAPDQLFGTVASAMTTDIVTAPGAGMSRIQEIIVRNRHASTACDVTIQIDRSGTDYELFKVTLQAGQTLLYNKTTGFYVTSLNIRLDKKLRVAADVPNATTSFADITGLTCAVESGKHYNFVAYLWHIENANTTGARFGINGPTMTAMRVGGMGVYTGSLTAAVMHAQVADIAALDTAVPGAATASTTTPQVTLFIMSGWINPSANGTFAVRQQSEIAVAAGITTKAGSWCHIWEADA